jgi:MoxR-like ATPase
MKATVNVGVQIGAGATNMLIHPPFFGQLETAVANGSHVMLMGPRGTGKTTAVRLLARQNYKKLHILPCHADMTTEELRGVPGLKGGNSTFVYSPLVFAVTNGDYVLMDEANLARPGVTAWLNNVLDDDGRVSIPETGEEFPVCEGFRLFLCFNVGYQGTRELNQALVDRCRVIYCSYWPPHQEKAILAARLPNLKNVDLFRMLRVANGVREARRKGSIDFDFSLRTLIQWGTDADQRTQDLGESFRAVVLAKVGDPLEYGPQHEALIELANLILSDRITKT